MRKPALLALALLAACSLPPAKVDPQVFANALAAPARLAKDRERDANRKPEAVFAFFGIAPGMKVLDVVSGGGYMTEYASWVVGPLGHVTAFNPKAFEGYVKDEVAVRYADGRLTNVTTVWQDMAAFSVPPNSFDAAIMVQNYHDMYWVEPKYGWTKVDAPKVLATIRASLKPNGVFGIVDHAAVAGSGIGAAQTLHRIEQAAVIADVTAAGFVLEASSTVLANPADDHTKSVFDESIRGKTDQFVLKFRKKG